MRQLVLGLCSLVVALADVNGNIPSFTDRDRRLLANFTYFTLLGREIPYVWELRPSGGPVSGGTSVRVVGEDFHETSAVVCRFGDQIVSGTFESTTHQVLCVSPALSAGLIPVEVSFDGGQQFTIEGVIFDAYVPTVTSCTPTSGSLNVNTTVLLHSQASFKGSEFLCRIGNLDPVPATKLTDSMLSCEVIPTSITTSQTLRIEIAGDTDNDGLADTAFSTGGPEFMLFDFPLPLAISPAPMANHQIRSNSLGGIQVSITGAGLNSSSQLLSPMVRIGDKTVNADHNEFTLTFELPSAHAANVQSELRYEFSKNQDDQSHGISLFQSAKISSRGLQLTSILPNQVGSATFDIDTFPDFQEFLVEFDCLLEGKVGEGAAGIAFVIFEEKLPRPLSHDGREGGLAIVLRAKTARSIDIVFHNEVVERFEGIEVLLDVWVPVSIDVIQQKLTVCYNFVCFTHTLANWAGIPNSKIGFSGFTTATFGRQLVDNFVIRSGSLVVSEVADIAISFNGQHFEPVIISGSTATVLYSAQPLISSISPSGGDVRGGANITIEGYHLGNVVECRFGDVVSEAEIGVDDTESNREKIFCILPEQDSTLTGTALPLSVSLNRQDFTYSSFMLEVYQQSASTVTKILPASVDATGDIIVSLYGEGIEPPQLLTNTAVVWVMLSTPVPVSAIWNTTCGCLEFRAPPSLGQNGPVDIGIAFNFQDSEVVASLTYTGPATLTMISPTTSVAIGDNLMAVQGSGFLLSAPFDLAKCHFGSAIVQATVLDDLNIRCTSPSAESAGVGTSYRMTDPSAPDLHLHGSSSVEGEVLVIAQSKTDGMSYVQLAMYDPIRVVNASFTLSSSNSRVVFFYSDLGPRTNLVSIGERGGGFGIVFHLNRVTVQWKGQIIASNSFSSILDWVEVSVRLSSDSYAQAQQGIVRMTVTVDDVDVVTEYQLDSLQPPFRPTTSWSFGFAASPREDDDIPSVKDWMIHGNAATGVPWSVPVAVTLNGRDFLPANTEIFMSYVSPTISAVSPSSREVGSNSTIVLSMQDLEESAVGSNYEYTCMFSNGTHSESTRATLQNSTFATCPSPSVSTHGLVQLVLTISRSNSVYESPPVDFFFLEPLLESLFPVIGSVGGGTTIHIEGTQFVPNLLVMCKFESLSESKTVLASAVANTQISCFSPVWSSQEEVNISVSLNGGQDFSSVLFYEYHSEPSISGFFPTSCSTDGGCLVTITGTNFYSSPNGIYRCIFGAHEFEGIYVSETEFRCVVPEFESVAAVSIDLTDLSEATTIGSLSLSGSASLKTVTSEVGILLTDQSQGAAGAMIIGSIIGILPQSFRFTSRFWFGGLPELTSTRFGGDSVTFIYASDPDVQAGEVSSVGIIARLNSHPIDTHLEMKATSETGLSVCRYYLANLRSQSWQNLSLTMFPNATMCIDISTSALCCSFDPDVVQSVLSSLTMVFGIHARTGDVVDQHAITNATFVVVPSRAEDNFPVLISLNAVDTIASPDMFRLFGLKKGTIALIEPSSGPLDETVRIWGDNLAGGSDYTCIFRFGGETITVAGFYDEPELLPPSFSSTSNFAIAAGPIRCSVPSLLWVIDPTSGDILEVAVTLNNQDEISNTDDVSFQVFEIFTIGSIYPHSGPRTGQTSVNVTLTDPSVLAAATQVMCRFTFPDSSYETVLADSYSGDLITCTTPALDRSREATITVTLNGQSFVGIAGGVDPSTNQFAFYLALEVERISPLQGYTAGGTTISLTGENLLSGDSDEYQCQFVGDSTSKVVAAVLGTEDITCETPDWPRTELIRVYISPNSQQFDTTTSNGNHFTFYETPTGIIGPQPAFGPTSGGTVILFESSSFTIGNDPRCLFRISGLADVEVVAVLDTDQAQISCISPKFPGIGSADVAVSLYGTDYVFTTTVFEIYENPTLLSLSSLSGNATGGLELTIEVNMTAYTELSSLICTFMDDDRTSSVPASSGLASVVCTTPPVSSLTLDTDTAFTCNFASRSGMCESSNIVGVRTGQTALVAGSQMLRLAMEEGESRGGFGIFQDPPRSCPVQFTATADINLVDVAELSLFMASRAPGSEWDVNDGLFPVSSLAVVINTLTSVVTVYLDGALLIQAVLLENLESQNWHSLQMVVELGVLRLLKSGVPLMAPLTLPDNWEAVIHSDNSCLYGMGSQATHEVLMDSLNLFAEVVDPASTVQVQVSFDQNFVSNTLNFTYV